jgi:hypothetical protein
MMSTASSAMTCRECHLNGGPFSIDEAVLHATTHNRLHHGGAPTASAVTLACQAENSAAA